MEDTLMTGIQAVQEGNTDIAISCFEDVLNNIDKSEGETYSTISYLLGTCYASNGHQEKACALFEQAIAVSNNNLTLSINIYPILLNSYSELNSPKASLTAMQMEKLLNEQKVGNLYWCYAVALLTYHQNVSGDAKAIEFGEYVQKNGTYIKGISELDSLSNIIEQNSFYMAMGNCYENLGMHKEALTSLLQSLNFISEQTVKNYATIYRAIANIYEKQHDNINALEYYLKSLENWNKYNYASDNLKGKAQILMSIGVIYNQTSTPLAAITYLEQAKDIYLKLSDTEYLTYTYGYLYTCYHSIGNLEKSAIYADLLSKSIVGVNNWTNEGFLICYSIYGDILKRQGKYSEAISIYKQLLDSNIQLYGIGDTRLFSNYYKLATSYLAINDLDMALLMIDKALNLASIAEEEQISAKLLLIEIDRLNGNLGKAISDCENLKSQILLLDGSTEVKSIYYSSLGGLYGEIGAYDKLLDASIKYREETMKLYGENSPKYAIALLNLSEAYAVCDKQSEALTCNLEAISILKGIYGEKSSQYYDALHKLGGFCNTSNNFNKAIEIYTNCMNLSKELYGETSKQFANDLISLYRIRIYNDIHNISTDDLNQYITGINLKRELGLTNNTYYLTELYTLSVFYYLLNDYDNLYLTDTELHTQVREYIKDNFIYLNDWQRAGLWKNVQMSIPPIVEGAAATGMPAYNKLAYNCALLYKALLLTSTNSLRDLILNSNDKQLKALHQNILNLKIELTKIDNPTILKQKEQELNDLQREELNKIKSLGDFVDFIDTDWSDVQNALKPNEATIEFVSFPTQDCISYAALVLTSQSMYPSIYPLFNDKELEEYSYDNITQFDYSSSEIYRIIWERLSKYALTGIETIYFSPDGILHKIPIENIADNTGTIANQKWKLYRVSSTREIIKNVTNPKSRKYNAVLYGGLRYNLKPEQLIEESRKAHRAVDLSNLRYGVDSLRWTKKEVEDIYNLFKTTKKAECDTIIGIGGTEESFKALANKNVGIIHLATHGFYWSEEDVEKRSYVRFLANMNNNMQTFEDKALLRSGLFFSGANIGLAGEELPNDVEDGVLTAKELSAMNLGNVDMVVMSACQSGLGETSGEGVFGLQRGFKLAGANTLLMSLWKVDDEATMTLMTTFYENMLAGMSKRESLLKAQKAVRETRDETRDWKDPQYWAGFILLDGLN